MGNLVQRVRSKRSIVSIDDYISAVNSFSYGGLQYPFGGFQQSMTGGKAPAAPADFAGFAHAYATNGVVFACMLARQSVFSATRFQFQRFNNGRPSEMWGNASLSLLEEPWAGGTTQDLLARMIQDADLAGSFLGVYDTPLVRLGTQGGPEIVRLRPDWTEIVLEPRMINGGQVGWRKIGFLYWEGGPGASGSPVPFLVDDVVHFMPNPDPLNPWRGMSWLTPVVREVQNDNLMNRHKQKFFENAATPNVIVRMDPAIQYEQFLKFKTQMDSTHKGVEDAYKTLYVGAAADVTIAGSDFKQMDFKTVQGAGETRIAAAAGVPPVVVGLSEGMQGSSLNAGNYGQARRNFADRTIHPLWQNAAGSLARLVPPPSGSRLWYDSRDVPFLREDEKDAAEIQGREAQTIRQLVDAGYTPDSIVASVRARDWGLLEHSGLYSVQLQPAGAQAPTELPALEP